MAKQQVQAVETQAATQSDFTQLLEREFRPKTDQARAAVEHAVQTLAEQALSQSITISDDAYKSIAAIIAQIDRKLSEQINLILHHDDYVVLRDGLQVVRHLDDRASLELLRHHPPDLPVRLPVHAAGRLVQHQHPAAPAVQDRPRQAEQLLLAPAEP